MIQGDECRPRRSSWLRSPWLTPIQNSSKLRGLCRRSYFGPRTCGRGINQIHRIVSGLSIRVSPSHPYNAGMAGLGWGVRWPRNRSIVLLLFLQKQNLATAIYLFGLGTLLTGLGLKHMRIRSHHDLAGALVTSLLLGRPWWSTTSPTCLPLSVFTITSDQHRCRIPPLL